MNDFQMSFSSKKSIEPSEGSALLREFAPFLLVVRLIGGTPLRIRKNTVELRYFSLEFLYFLVVSLAQFIPVAWFCFHGLRQARERDDGMLVSALVYFTSMFVPYTLPFLMTIQASQQVKFVTAFNNFQVAYEARVPSPLCLGLRRRTYIGMLVIILIASSILTWRPIVQHRRPTFDDCFHVFAQLHSLPLIFSWHLSCAALSKLSQLLFHDFEKALRGKQVPVGGRESSLLELRTLWLRHCGLIMQSGSCVALAQIVLLGFNFGRLLGFLYQIVRARDPTMITVMTGMAVICVLNIIVVCAASNDVSVQMQHFCTQMIRICPPISFNGYVNVDRGLLSTLLGALVTNLIVLVQLGVRQKAFDTTEFLNFGESFIPH